MPERRVGKGIEIGEKADLQTADTDRDSRRDDLHNELELGAKCEHIIENAERYDDRCAEQHAQHGLVELTKDENRAQKTTENSKTAKPRDRLLVHAPIVLRNVDRADLVREPLDRRRKEI